MLHTYLGTYLLRYLPKVFTYLPICLDKTDKQTDEADRQKAKQSKAIHLYIYTSIHLQIYSSIEKLRKKKISRYLLPNPFLFYSPSIFLFLFFSFFLFFPSYRTSVIVYR